MPQFDTCTHIQNCKLPCNRIIFKTRSKLSGSGINYNAIHYYHMDLFTFEQRGCTVILAPETSKVLGHTQSASFWTSFIQDTDRYTLQTVLKLSGEPQQRCSIHQSGQKLAWITVTARVTTQQAQSRTCCSTVGPVSVWWCDLCMWSSTTRWLCHRICFVSSVNWSTGCRRFGSILCFSLLGQCSSDESLSVCGWDALVCAVRRGWLCHICANGGAWFLCFRFAGRFLLHQVGQAAFGGEGSNTPCPRFCFLGLLLGALGCLSWVLKHEYTSTVKSMLHGKTHLQYLF